MAGNLILLFPPFSCYDVTARKGKESGVVSQTKFNAARKWNVMTIFPVAVLSITGNDNVILHMEI